MLHFNLMEGLQEDTTKKKPWHAIASTEASQHGSLLAVSTMLAYTRDFMLPRFEEVCRAVLACTKSSRALIRLEAVRLVPRLARRHPQIFGRRYLEESLVFLMQSAATPPGPRIGVDLRPAAFASLGRLILAMTDESTGLVIGGSSLPTIKISDDPSAIGRGHIVELSNSGIIFRKLPEIFSLVRKGLQVVSAVKNSEMSSVKPALHCAASLVEALGDLALPYVSELINDMFRAGLSNDLILCLQSMAECVPVQQNEIEDRMLQNIYMCLAGQASVQTPGAHSRDSIVDHEVLVESSKGSKRFMFQSSLDEIIYDPTSGKVQFQADAGTESSVPIINMGDDPNTVEALVLGLETLAFFGGSMSRVTTSGAIVQLLPFVQDVAACYLLHPNEVVRRASALTCIALLIPYGTSHTNQIGGFSGIIVEDVLEKLLRVAASDISPTVRLYVVRALDSRYDAYLCQSHHLQQLFLLLQDEALATKAASIRLLGRLAFLNPAPILPVLRRRLNELIVELECGAGTGRMREEATRLLSVFLRSVPLQRIVHPVLHTIVSALPLDKTAPPRLASASLEALGELAQVSGMALQPWIKDVMPHVLEIMEDRSSASKQRTSLRTLGQIAGSTGYVILPYVDYPELLSNATAILPATKRAPWSLRREVIRTLGILGAYDPDRYYETASRARKGGGGAYFEVDVNDNMNSDIFQGWEKVPVATPTLRNLPLPKGGITILQQQPKRSGSRSYSRGSIEEIRDDDETEPAYLFMYEQYAMVAQPVSLLPPDKRMTPSDDDFYPTVTIQALMRIFRDPSLAVHHGVVVQGIMFIFKSLGLRCVPYLGKVVPQMIHVLRTCGPSNLRESLLVQLAMLSTIVREHLRPYVADIFEVAEQLWSSRHVATIFNLVSNLAFATPNEFRVFIPKLVVLLVSTFDEVQVTDWSGAARTGAAIVGKGLVADQKLGLVLKGICNLKGVLGGYLRIIVSALLKLADSLASLSFSNHSSLPDALLIELSLSVYRTVSSLLENPASAHSKDQLICPEGKVGWKQTSENGLSTRAVQPLVRILRDKPPQSPIIGIAIIETLCVCASNIGGLLWVQLYDTVVRDAIMAWKATQIVIVQIEVVSPPHRADDRIASCLEHYDDTIDELMAPKTEMGRSATFKRGNNYGPREGVPFATSSFLESTTEMFDQTTLQGTAQTGISGLNRLKVNHVKLQRAWDVAQRASRDDWEEWMRRLGIQLLREAPSPSLHACASLAHAYQPLARELFCAAFACCWKELSEPYRANLVYALKTAFVSDVSPEILQMLLNLAEFMEQDPSGGLPIEISVLADLALKCRAYAKALHYTEREYNLGGSTACVESLISINGRLDFPGKFRCINPAQHEFVTSFFNTL